MDIARRQIRWNGWGWTAHHDSLAEKEALWRWLAGELGMPALLATPARPLEDISLPAPLLTPQQIGAFADIVGADRVTRDDQDRARHARGRSYHDLLCLRAGDLSAAPDAVLYPRGEDEVLAILQLAARENIPVIPFGGGTGMAGGVTAGPGRVSVDLSGMDRLLEADIQNGMATAEAGITGAALEKALAAKGLSLAHTPEVCEFSTLGGWIASSGACDGLAQARLATPQGILDTGDGPGPDLKHLVAGSEGAFGIITRAVVRVRPAVAPLGRGFWFRDFTAGAAAIREAVRAEIPHHNLRLSDGEETRFEQAFADLDTPRGLIRRLRDAWRAARHGSRAAVAIVAFADSASAQRFENLVKKHGGRGLGDAPFKQRLADHFLVPYRQNAFLDRGVGSDTLEFAASWSDLPGIHAAVRTALDQAMRDHAPRAGAHGLVQCHLAQAHAGGARLSFNILFPRQLENEIAQGRAIRRAGRDAALAHGGVPRQGVGEDNLEDVTGLRRAVLRGVKATLDPQGVLNPGKLISPP